MILQEHTIFADRYQLERLLGRGGFSEVWLATDNWTHLQVAIKVYAPGQGMNADGLQDFCSELANVFELNHTNLLKPTHVDSWNDMPYLIMAYCSQGALTKKIQKLTEFELWKLIHDVASGLAYLHDKDVVHQDIKPDNILIDNYGNYVITDFGISSRARNTLRKSVIGGAISGGTTAYMGPERFSKQPAPTKASDIWSFGAMLFELIEGDMPFGEMGGGVQKAGADMPEINASVSCELKELVGRMLAPQTWDRPTAVQLKQIAATHNQIPASYTEGCKTQLLGNAEGTTTAENPEIEKPKKKLKKHILWSGIVCIFALFLLYVLYAGCYFSCYQKYVSCDADGLSNYFGQVKVTDAVFGNQMGDWWWTIENQTKDCVVRKGDGGYWLSVLPNNSSEERQLEFYIKPRIGSRESVIITQAGKNEQLSINKSTLSFSAYGGTKVVTVSSNIDWDVQSSSGNMFTVARKNNDLTVKVSPNTSSNSRVDYLVVKSRSGNKSAKVELKQPGKPSANISKVWMEHNTTMYGDKGTKLHITFDADNVYQHELLVCVHLSEDGKPFALAKNNTYGIKDGQTTLQGGELSADHTHNAWSDYQLFIPYASLMIPNSKTELTLKAEVEIFDKTEGKWISSKPISEGATVTFKMWK